MATQFQEQPFSLFAGGPFYQLLRRSRLCTDGLELLYRRTVALTLIAWLPLFVLAAMQGQLLGGSLQIPFLLDAETQARFLVALPLLVIAEYVVHRRMQATVAQFTEHHLIAPGDMERYQRAKASAQRLRDSWLAEALLVVLVLAFGGRVVSAQFGVVQADWQVHSPANGSAPSAAGLWLAYVSLPLFRFLAWRWYFRMFIWGRFLWQVSRLELHLVPTHPDGSGGLGFLNGGVTAFMPLAVAHGVVLCGVVAQRILHHGAALTDFNLEAAAIVSLMLCLLVAPLLLFSLRLARVQRNGVREYGSLAARYVDEFESKWLRGRIPAGEQLIGTPDIQSLADLGNSFEIVERMNVFVVSKMTVVWVLIYTLGPIVPLLLTMMPLQDLLKKLFQMLF